MTWWFWTRSSTPTIWASFRRNQVIEMMEKKPEGTELVITGHDYGMDISALTDRADYVTKFVKEKHPFDLGMGCRKGIEE